MTDKKTRRVKTKEEKLKDSMEKLKHMALLKKKKIAKGGLVKKK